jgi:hypothetical protein
MSDNGDDAARMQAMADELNAEDAELGVDREPLNFNRPAEAEAYDPERHGAPEPRQQQQDDFDPSRFMPRGQPEQSPQLPDVQEDPLGHFDGRMAQIEGHAARQAQIDTGRNVHAFVTASEERAREELGDDYNGAVQHLETSHRAKLAQQFPDGQHSDLLAHSYGLRNAGELREALFNRDRQIVVAHALQNGLDPASVYYDLAVRQYGYAPQNAMTRTQMNKLLAAAEQGGAEFDKAWERYAAAERRAEHNRKARR